MVWIVIEDIDFSGSFCYPYCAAYEMYMELYKEAAHRRGVDPNIGPKLAGMLCQAGAAVGRAPFRLALVSAIATAHLSRSDGSFRQSGPVVVESKRRCPNGIRGSRGQRRRCCISFYDSKPCVNCDRLSKSCGKATPSSSQILYLSVPDPYTK
jgi:hypothetical protein